MYTIGMTDVKDVYMESFFQDGGVINKLIVKAISKNVSVYTHSSTLSITVLLWCCGFQSVSEGKSEGLHTIKLVYVDLCDVNIFLNDDHQCI